MDGFLGVSKFTKAGRSGNRGAGTLTTVTAAMLRSGTARVMPALDPIVFKLAEQGDHLQ